MRRTRREAGPALTLDLIHKIETAIIAKKWDHATLAKKSGVGIRTIQSWLDNAARARAESGDPLNPRLLIHVADALGLALTESAQQSAPSARHQHLEFHVLSGVATAVDDELIQVTRRLSSQPLSVVRTAYRRVLNDGLREHGWTMTEWIDVLEDSARRANLVASLPDPELRVEIAPDFGHLEFLLPDGRRLPVDRPKLLWDCACDSPDAPPRPCPIHADPLGSRVQAAFHDGAVEVTWRGLRLRWRNQASLWPPSVDSFSLLLDIEHVGVFGAPSRTILDLGSGTGVLGIAAANLSHAVKHVVLADWLLSASLYGAINWSLNFPDSERTLSVRVGLFSDWEAQLTPELPCSIVLCNPPYLPVPTGFERFAVHSIVAGTDLLSHIIENAGRLGERVFLNFSSLAVSDALGAATRFQKALVPVQEPRLVPFRVRRAWTEIPEYFQALRQIPNGLIVRPGERHPVWHAIRTYEVTPSKEGEA